MTTSVLLPLLITLAQAQGPAPAPQGYTLEECFQAALQRSEVIGTQSELITQAEERYNQAKAAIFPTINGVASYLVQQTPPATGSAASIAPAEQTTAKITATQPIFHGMREYAAIIQANLLVTAQMSAKRQAAAALYGDVASNFYTILQLEQDLRDLNNTIEIDQQQIVELNARVRIGRSRPSEVLTVKAAVDTLSATAEQVRGQLLATREAFVFLTGFDRGAPIRETETLDVKVDPLQAYLSHLDERPDVKASRDSLEATDKNIGIARGLHFPQIDLTGDYFFKRPGISQDQHWDVLITGTLPIFAGGAVNAQVRQAVSQARQAELAAAATRRQADQEIRADFDNLTSDIAQVDRLDRATKTAYANYEAQKHDYRLGLVTNLDVLTAIGNFETSQRTLDHTRYQLKLDYLKMQIATAKKPVQDR